MCLTLKIGARYITQVDSFEAASRKFQSIRDGADLGASQMPEGRIYDASGVQIASISYNGRVWHAVPDAWQSLTDNLICEAA